MKELILGVIIAAVLLAIMLYLVLLTQKQTSDAANNFLEYGENEEATPEEEPEGRDDEMQI
jgi:flagellar basal body-associated protein FliL